ncbi:MAG: trypsin-like peptidase domain-containing protein [Clostridia bacterium]|nr:trypsin-like peptidase domain-containing protein [Clostridia bacterium]
MSDYIYNNFSNYPDKNTDEPVNIYFATEPKPPKKNNTLIITICSLCIVFSFMAGILGVIFANGFANTNSTNKNINSQNGYTAQIFSSVVETEVNYDVPNGYFSRTQVVSMVKDSVVEIQTEEVSYQYTSTGAGSGVIIGKYFDDNDALKGYLIVTNAHVITSSSGSILDTIKIRTTNGTEYYVSSVRGCDKIGDIAVLAIETTDTLTVANWISDEEDILLGEDVIAIGNPLGQLGGTVTDGIISALDRTVTVEGVSMSLIQTSAAVNSGNSGGGLFNMKGQLIGIVNAKSTGTNVEGLGFAIPASDAKKIQNDLITYGYVQGRAGLGIIAVKKTSSSVQISELKEGFNEDKLKIGDIIDSINGIDVTSPEDIEIIESTLTPGDTVEIVVIRGRYSKTLEITVGTRNY